ncbi:MAG: tRNA pseudouridine(55) synthase TruB [Patescibacteria group bacterium]|jgi:tRNA pseudouridine55 synthase
MIKKVLVFGKFDILHPGHMHILALAKKLGQVTVVLESDQAIQSLRNYIPYNNQKIRKSNLENLGFTVFVRNTIHDAKYLINTLQPDILCMGEDQKYLQDTFSNFDNLHLEIIKFVKSNLYKSSKLRSILEDKSAGIYLIDKAKGVNSFHVVSVLRKVLNLKQVGFSGTLDPLASGLMILASGKATKLLDWFHDLPKIYQADVIFGQESDTYDMEGNISINKNAQGFGKVELGKVLDKFFGKQIQVVPIYSAKKVAGKKLYKLARAGKEVKAPSKEIEIYKLKINKFKYPNLSLETSVSAGTYIRSLAYDLGRAMGTGAMLADLRRVAIGDFVIKKALPLDKVDKASLLKNKIAPQDIIKSLNQYLGQ